MNLNLSMSGRKPRGELAAIFARLPAKNQPRSFRRFTRLYLPAAHLADDLLTSIAAFSGLSSTRAQEDDITLLVLRFPISKRWVHKSGDKNSEANYVRALQP
ncbi:MAG TPA: hypothetical protein VK514_03640 [Candidatus Acidoferrum sp.]|nr:hypothetical protein [Candidatus Acidoferrum sp.]